MREQVGAGGRTVGLICPGQPRAPLGVGCRGGSGLRVGTHLGLTGTQITQMGFQPHEQSRKPLNAENMAWQVHAWQRPGRGHAGRGTHGANPQGGARAASHADCRGGRGPVASGAARAPSRSPCPGTRQTVGRSWRTAAPRGGPGRGQLCRSRGPAGLGRRLRSRGAGPRLRAAAPPGRLPAPRRSEAAPTPRLPAWGASPWIPALRFLGLAGESRGAPAHFNTPGGGAGPEGRCACAL